MTYNTSARASQEDTATDTSGGDRSVESPPLSFRHAVPAGLSHGAAHGTRAERSRAVQIALGVCVAAAVAGGATLIGEVATEPDPTPLRAAVSPSDLTLGYLLSEEVPVDVREPVGTSAAPGAPSPADLALGCLLSGSVPVEVSDLAGSRSADCEGCVPHPSDLVLGHLLSADAPDTRDTERSAAGWPTTSGR